MSEYEELQSLMADSSDVEAKPNRNMGGNECAPPSQAGASPKVVFQQWVVEPNGSFSATGATEAKLPPAVYRIDQDSYGGIHFVKVPTLSDTLFDLDDSASQRVISGIRTFWKSRQSFTDLGILYKRGVLLWGPAGSGKTATVYQLMGELVDGGGVVILADNPSLVTRALEIFRTIENGRPLIVVLEDIEEMIDHHGEHDLLALLDGEHQIDNVVHIATTNYPERLGARIVNRPSRFDEVIKVGMPTDNARRRYFKFVLGEDFAAEKWVEDTKNLSVAHLRELVVATQCLGRPYEETLERLRRMAIKPNSSSSGNAVGLVQ